jgi:hypothetical protein
MSVEIVWKQLEHQQNSRNTSLRAFDINSGRADQVWDAGAVLLVYTALSVFPDAEGLQEHGKALLEKLGALV